MADDATIKSGTAGSDIRTATDEAAYDGLTASHAQLVKLVDGTADSIQRILAGTGTATGALRTATASNSPDVTALEIMDDWDETDRAKVNIIAGVAGITAGAGSVAAGTPRVTLAADDPAVALLTTIDADTGNLGGILTSVQLIDDTVFAEDVAATIGDKGISVLAVRRDADTSLVGTDNDYAQLQVDARGALKVEAFSGETLPVSLASVPSHAVTNAGTFAVQVDGAALTSLQLIDDAAVVLGTATYTEATSTGLAIGAVRRDADTTLVSLTNEWGPLQMDANGRLKVEIFDGGDSHTIDNADLTAAAASLAVIDDWDETDRAKVNIIVGVAGITAGAGAVAAGTPRVTLASDDPLLAEVQSITHAEDAAHSTGHMGIMALAVRNDAGTALAGLDLDYIPLTTNSAGALYVTGGGGGTQYVEDVAAAVDPTGTMMMAVRLDTPVAITSLDGDNIAVRATNKGEVYVKHTDAIPVTLTSTTVTGTVTVDSELPAAAALTDNFANPTAPGVGAFGMLWDGALWDRAFGNSTDGALVNLGANNDVVATGLAAEDAALSGNPVRIGGRASNAKPTAMSADGDVVSPWMALSGGIVRQMPQPARAALSFAAGLQSLATSTTVGTASAEVDLTADMPTDLLVQMIFTHGGSAPSGAQVYEIYCITSQDGTDYDGDTTYSGTAAAYTLGGAASINLHQLGVLRAHAANGVYRKTFSLRAQIGFIPRFFAIVVINNAGTGLAASGNSGNYTLVY